MASYNWSLTKNPHTPTKPFSNTTGVLHTHTHAGCRQAKKPGSQNVCVFVYTVFAYKLFELSVTVKVSAFHRRHSWSMLGKQWGTEAEPVAFI